MRRALTVAALALALAACQPQVVTKIVEVPAPKSDYQRCEERVIKEFSNSQFSTSVRIMAVCGPASAK